MNVYLITGASKGIGLALSKELMSENNVLICVARTTNEELLQLGKEKECHIVFLEYDLVNIEGLEELIKTMVAHLPANPHSITLINNAGVVDPIGRTENNKAEGINKSITLNLTAPMVLSSAFIKHVKDYPIQKKIINISSGAGRNPYTGWSSYCASKAGLDHYTRVVSQEQDGEINGVKIISIAPGIIDTGMQEKIRSVDEKDFELVGRFIDYKEQGQLSSPEFTAQKLKRIIESKTFNKLDPILDLREL
ncbi:(S)-benzoin forming benzil reductase [Lederbergia lenta]|uniref:Short chain dehydrogenase n=1 Tax=Lederbergia lenta TaxID=1467 RepID=A0A2X4WBZ9_LEDLE|nr:(S)-benzoin forming benzil reductase [Lederbergia lenta]MCM3110367.1 (S)-benzoin forming benzil reductase [Lederbergia lenta]MEC2324067.1 (S)-benzoin forming benzil reductase [Lederbergia lenta]SQI60691.1 short chain dehydrogenase [Lederbergia lenta]